MPSRARRPLATNIWRVLLWSLIPAYLLYLVHYTTFFQGVYIATVRDMYFACMRLTETPYAYQMVTGTCALANLEYKVTMTHDAMGFRDNGAAAGARIVVLGDSHAYGHGVNDDQTFAALLASQLGEPVRNLALPAFATRRELEAYVAQARAAPLIVLQYCNNDLDENVPSLALLAPVYLRTLHQRMGEVIKNYHHTKQQGAMGQTMLALAYGARQLVQARFFNLPMAAPDEASLPQEADAFAAVLAQYQPWLDGKTVVVLESSGWGRNRKAFKTVFAQRLQALPHVNWLVLDSSAVLTSADYFRLDDHLNASGHRRLALALAPLLRQALTEKRPAWTRR